MNLCANFCYYFYGVKCIICVWKMVTFVVDTIFKVCKTNETKCTSDKLKNAPIAVINNSFSRRSLCNLHSIVRFPMIQNWCVKYVSICVRYIFTKLLFFEITNDESCVLSACRCDCYRLQREMKVFAESFGDVAPARSSMYDEMYVCSKCSGCLFMLCAQVHFQREKLK